MEKDLNRRSFLKLAGTAVSVATFGSYTTTLQAKRAKKKKPNILFVMLDDLGKEWVETCGSEESLTPTVDKLAAEGMQFVNAYSMPQCTPTRVTLLTGRYPFNHGWINHWDVPRWGKGCHFDWKHNISFGNVMKSAGYATAAAGKWQINDFRVTPDAMVKHGFDDYCMWTGYEGDNPPSAERYWNPYINTKDGSKTYKDKFGADVFTDYLIDFMKRKKDKPMMMYFPMCLPHGPLTTTPSAPNVSEKYEMHRAMVRYTDHCLKRLVDTLDDLGIRDNTIVIWTTDNGTAKSLSAMRNGRLVRGGKTLTTENGICAPFIVNCPGLIPAGVKTETLTDFTDMLPTFAELGGAKIPKDAKLDGVSIAKVILGKKKDSSRKWTLAMGSHGGTVDQDGWVVPIHVFRDRVLRDKRFKLFVGTDRKPEGLYDVVKDPAEKNNLVNSKDKAAVAAKKKFMAVVDKMPKVDAAPKYDKLSAQPWDIKIEEKKSERDSMNNYALRTCTRAKAILFVLLVTAVCLPAFAGDAAKTNIVLIMADDVSPDLYGCYGNELVSTPNIDKMAKEGVMFRTAWASAICAPSRALITTGRYGSTTGVYQNAMWLKDASKRLYVDNKSFGKMVKDAGYATAIAGKWHCGAVAPYKESVGFDEYCLWETTKAVSLLEGSPKYKNMYDGDGEWPRFWQPCIIKNHKLVKTGANDFGPDIFTEFICDFIERNKDKPFLAYYPMVAPHGTREGVSTTPLRGKVGEMGKSDSPEENEARFRALNEYIDVCVGRIVKKVESLGLLDNTLIIFCADNGTGVTAKNRGVERGSHVPFVAFGADVKKRGATDELMDFSDVLPTLVDYAGGDFGDYKPDGKSLKPFLSGKTNKHKQWIYSCIATSQLLRTKDYMLEVVNPILGMPKGRFYHTGNNRFGKGYELVNDEKEHAKARKKFDKILKQFPPLTKDNPFWESKRGQVYWKEIMDPKYAKKHLHNHSDYQFYEE
ncbi:MAG: sulfatase-like hydrolase/transferase [Phycisphaerae bacterium]|nr:sulfatase-like hydrolase/transferase [Phycisphaerae bacterium]